MAAQIFDCRKRGLRATLSELASDGGFFIFMLWHFHRGLEPYSKRAHNEPQQ
jgi:hypothetical protein